MEQLNNTLMMHEDMMKNNDMPLSRRDFHFDDKSISAIEGSKDRPSLTNSAKPISTKGSPFKGANLNLPKGLV